MSEDTEPFTIEIEGLEKLMKALKENPPTLKIGVLGGGRNASIGAVHEFGAPARGIPQRSFLRVPLSENLNKELEKSGLLDKEALDQVIKAGSMIPWMKQVGIAAEAVVDDAFETSGDGKWAPWKNPNYHNGGGMLLVDSGQLREAVTSEVSS